MTLEVPKSERKIAVSLTEDEIMALPFHSEAEFNNLIDEISKLPTIDLIQKILKNDVYFQKIFVPLTKQELEQKKRRLERLLFKMPSVRQQLIDRLLSKEPQNKKDFLRLFSNDVNGLATVFKETGMHLQMFKQNIERLTAYLLANPEAYDGVFKGTGILANFGNWFDRSALIKEELLTIESFIQPMRRLLIRRILTSAMDVGGYISHRLHIGSMVDSLNLQERSLFLDKILSSEIAMKRWVFNGFFTFENFISKFPGQNQRILELLLVNAADRACLVIHDEADLAKCVALMPLEKRKEFFKQLLPVIKEPLKIFENPASLQKYVKALPGFAAKLIEDLSTDSAALAKVITSVEDLRYCANLLTDGEKVEQLMQSVLGNPELRSRISGGAKDHKASASPSFFAPSTASVTMATSRYDGVEFSAGPPV